MPTKPDTQSKKAKKAPPTKSKAACKSYLDKVIFAIRELKEHGGSSRQGIAKFVSSQFCGGDKAALNKMALKKALKRGEASGVLAREKQSFRFAADGAYEREAGTFVEFTDEKVGTGAVAEAGDTVKVSYRGTLQETGCQFDAAKSFSFTLNAGEVIKGWGKSSRKEKNEEDGDEKKSPYYSSNCLGR